MSEQAYLIRIRRSFSPRVVKALVDQIRRMDGEVLLLTDGGYALIARFEDSHRDRIAALPEVALIGGVQLQPRRIRRIRYDTSGRLLPSAPGENGGYDG